MAHPHHGLGRTRPVEQQDPGMPRSAGEGIAGRAMAGPSQSASRCSSSRAMASGSTSPATTIPAPARPEESPMKLDGLGSLKPGDDRLDAVEGIAVGMRLVVDRRQQAAVGARLGAVALRLQRRQGLAVDSLPLRLGE